MKRLVYLDMDGVLDDFVGGATKAHGREYPYLNGRGQGEWNLEKVWGITTEEFWAPTNNYDFWFNLEKTPEADMIVQLAFEWFGEGNVAILTSPSLFDGCMSAKRAWIKKYYPSLEKSMLFGYKKGLVAGPGKVLIDDRDRNVEDFNEYGGKGILVPRAWNKNNGLVDVVVPYIVKELWNEFAGPKEEVVHA